MISKNLFCKYIIGIKNHLKKVEKFEEALSPFFERAPVCTVEDDLVDLFIELFTDVTECAEDDLFYWWLFDSGSDKTITIKNSETGEEKTYDTTDPAILWEYIRDLNTELENTDDED